MCLPSDDLMTQGCSGPGLVMNCCLDRESSTPETALNCWCSITFKRLLCLFWPLWRLTEEANCARCFATVAISLFSSTAIESSAGRAVAHFPSTGPVRNRNILWREQEVYSWLDLEIFRTRFSAAKGEITLTTDVDRVLLPWLYTNDSGTNTYLYVGTSSQCDRWPASLWKLVSSSRSYITWWHQGLNSLVKAKCGIFYGKNTTYWVFTVSKNSFWVTAAISSRLRLLYIHSLTGRWMWSLNMGGEGGDFWGLCLTADVGLSCWKRARVRFSVIHSQHLSRHQTGGENRHQHEQHLSIIDIAWMHVQPVEEKPTAIRITRLILSRFGEGMWKTEINNTVITSS